MVATLAQLFYASVHLPAAMGALFCVRLDYPYAFRRARDTFVVLASAAPKDEQRPAASLTRPGRRRRMRRGRETA